MELITTCIIEDQNEIRAGLADLLTQDGRFEVKDSYSDAETATKELEAWQPDIVVMDINLPGMNGIECIRKLKPSCPHTEFIMYTVYEDDEKVFDALMAGASGYLLKKTSLDKICDALVELKQGGSPMSTQIARKVISRLQANASAEKMDVLSPRENSVLHYLAKGLLYKEIAAELMISASTVGQHVHKIYTKLHVQNRAEAINKMLGR
jgi:DNA-binding NarL/FixJ family response regulator